MENFDVVKTALAEHGDVVKGLAAGLAENSDSVKSLQAQFVDLAQQQTSAFGMVNAGPVSALDSVLKSTELSALRNRTTKSALMPFTASVTELRKSVVGDAGGVGDSPLSVQAQRANGVFNDARRNISLLDLIPRVQVASNSFEFVQLDGFANAAGYQLAEGDVKAEQTLPTAVITAPIVTVAITIPASEQVIADSPMLGQFLNSKLTFGVLEKMERELIAGAGTAGTMTGLYTQATLFTQTVSIAPADAIGEALAQLEINGWQGNAIVLHPTDWQAIRSERNAGGEYVATGWNSPAAPNVWGVSVVTSSAMTVGTALVMDAGQVALLDRMSPRFEIGRVNSQFNENMLTMRAEVRGGIAVFSPSAVLKLTL
ncbi:MAG TPA: phage major capsid protein [Marinobacter sp.]|nr:phage major capsid protein [Marinobacter sp.]